MVHVRYEVIDCSKYRKAFVVGDIHGEFLKFDRALYDAGFNPSTDVVISVGDIIDRGPRSQDFEYYLAKPWFKRVLGTHEDQVGEYLKGYETRENVIANGGAWYVDKPRGEIERIAALLEYAPLAMEVITPGGKRVGITHADLQGHWDSMQVDLKDPELERAMLNMLVNSRDTIGYIRLTKDAHPESVHVRGIDHVFHGHTPVDQPFTFANRTWIDTDRGDEGGQLTVLDIDAFLNER